MIYGFLGAITLFILIVITVSYFLSAPKYQGSKSDHFDGQKFKNMDGIKARGLSDVLKWQLNSKKGPWETKKDIESKKAPGNFSDSNSVQITFVNHSTFLIQMDGFNILTDPVWSERASPFSWAGPKRKRIPGIKMKDLPKINFILLSHNHYDHLDISALQKLYEKHKAKIFCPLGVDLYLIQKGINNTQSMDWWDETEFDSFNIISVPAQHFSGRGMFDRDATLWSGFLIERNKHKIYFAGDSGYNQNLFKQIGDRFKEIDISFIPIGAYKPEWFMSPVHVSPNEAVKIHKDVHSKKSIGMHFGTFALADEGQKEPITDLKKAMQVHAIPESDFITLKEGISKKFEF